MAGTVAGLFCRLPAVVARVMTSRFRFAGALLSLQTYGSRQQEGQSMQELLRGQNQPPKRKHGAQVELSMAFTSRTMTDTEVFFAAWAVLFPVMQKAAAAAGVSMMTPSLVERFGTGRAYKEAPGRFRATTYVNFASELQDWEEASAWLRTALAQMSHPKVRVDAVSEARVGA